MLCSTVCPQGACLSREILIPEDLKQKITAGKYSLQLKLSPELWDMIAKLLTVNPGQRPRIDDVVSFPWLKHGSEGPPNSFRERTNSHPDPTVMVITG